MAGGPFLSKGMAGPKRKWQLFSLSIQIINHSCHSLISYIAHFISKES